MRHCRGYRVRYALLSDIHANIIAFERVVNVLADHAVDRFVVLGDLVGYGARPNECCDLVRELDALVIRGNHDEAAIAVGKEKWFTKNAAACIIWTREQLSAENLAFLAALPPSARVPGAHFSHGSLPDPDHYTTTPTDAMLSFAAMEESLCFIGHTHYAEFFVLGPGETIPAQHSRVFGGECVFHEKRAYLVNPGSVGQPRDSNSQAACAIWDTQARRVEFLRVSYDFETAGQQILDAGLPANMAQRLRFGM